MNYKVFVILLILGAYRPIFTPSTLRVCCFSGDTRSA